MLKVEGSMREESHDKEQSSPTNCLPELKFLLEEHESQRFLYQNN
ncbi:hypothetical protein SAMN05421777_112105 [Fluoribacter gormanii]|uniref:Uncharacterized protein n=1 Tax=Fluoribacter gormanii TaxID=464 RepID=A0A377GK17_9GAMM|nr:hypothetical protein SAMN05421777_112105 [Fluoribacter gormanii]STO25167.1 Uncharacterised protein [Fluoribacter gormanii]